MLTDVLILIVVFGSIVAIVKIIGDIKTRHRLIEKGMVDEKVKYLFLQSAELQRLSSLKWGMVLVGVGIALLISFIWPDIFNEEGVAGLLFLFAGISFLTYYAIARKSFPEQNDR